MKKTVPIAATAEAEALSRVVSGCGSVAFEVIFWVKPEVDPSKICALPRGFCSGAKQTLLGGAEAFAVVAVLGDVVSPGAVFQIPVHGFGEAGFEGFAGRPAEFGLEF